MLTSDWCRGRDVPTGNRQRCDVIHFPLDVGGQCGIFAKNFQPKSVIRVYARLAFVSSRLAASLSKA